jgi:hypothetical protein
MKKQIEFKSGYLVIEIQKPSVKWVNKRILGYVVKCAKQGRFDILGMSTEEAEKIIKDVRR